MSRVRQREEKDRRKGGEREWLAFDASPKFVWWFRITHRREFEEDSSVGSRVKAFETSSIEGISP